MSSCRCGCPRNLHEHHHRATYCGRKHDEPCDRYTPRRMRWWQIWRQP